MVETLRCLYARHWLSSCEDAWQHVLRHCDNARPCALCAVLHQRLRMSNFRSSRRLQLAIGLLLAAPAIVAAQQPAPGSAATAPDTGQMAPDFTLPGSTRFGLLKDPIKLSNFRGQTVVLAFFP